MIIEYTKHASERMRERGITSSEIKKSLGNGLPKRYKGTTACVDYGDIRVAFNKDLLEVDGCDEERFTIITVYKINETLEEQIKKIPYPNQWWKEDNKEIFINQAYKLKELEMEDGEIIELLTSLYTAVCSEFGE